MTAVVSPNVVGKLMGFMAIVYTLQLLMFGGQMWSDAYADVPTGVPTGVDQVWGFFSFVFKMITFDIPELPLIVRMLFVIPFIAMIVMVGMGIALNIIEIVMPDWL